MELPGLPVLLSVCGLLSNSLVQVYALWRLDGSFLHDEGSSWEEPLPLSTLRQSCISRWDMMTPVHSLGDVWVRRYIGSICAPQR